MSVTCSLGYEPAQTVPLAHNAVLQQAYGKPLLQLAARAVTRLLPNVEVEAVDAPADLRHAWVQRGRVYLNTAYARADALLHEVSHLFIAAVRARPANDAQRRTYEQLASQLYGSPIHNKVAERYPIRDGYTMADQLDEAVNQLLGLRLTQRVGAQASLFHRLRAVLSDTVAAITGSRALGDYAMDRSVTELVNALADDFLKGPPMDIPQQDLENLIAVSRDLKVDLAPTTGELLSRLAGRRETKSETDIRTEAERYIKSAVAAGKKMVSLPNPRGGKNGVQVPAKIDDVIRHLKDVEAARKSTMIEEVFNLFNLKHTDRIALLKSAPGSKARLKVLTKLTANGQLDPQVLSHLADELAKIAPDLEENDAVVRYNRAEMDAVQPGLYNPVHDDGQTLIAVLRRKDAQGNPITLLRVIQVTDQDMTEKSGKPEAGDRPLLHGEYGSSWWGLAQGWGAEHFGGFDLTGSPRNRLLLQGSALAMHLGQQGVQVDGLAVAKIDLTGDGSGENRNDVQLTPMSEYIDAWKGLLRLPRIKALMNPELLATFADEKVFDKKRYERNYLQLLLGAYANRVDVNKLTRALGEYAAARNAGQARKLIEAMEERLGQLKAKYKTNDNLFVRNAEVILLGNALSQLYDVRQLQNRHKDIGLLEQLVRQWNAGDNPVFQWLYKEIMLSRKLAKDIFLNYREKRMEVFKALMDDFHQHEGAFNPLYHDEGKYYEALLVHAKHTVSDGKGGTMEVEVNEHRLKMPGTPEYEKLRQPQKDAVDFMREQIKKTVIERYQRENPGKKPLDVAAWYAEGWGRGYLPIIPGSVKRAIGAGSWDDQGREIAEQMLTDNYLYDRQDNNNKDGLSDMLGQQRGDGPHGSASRMRMLGYVAEEQMNQTTQKMETVYVLDQEKGLRMAKSVEPDLRKSLDHFAMSYAKHEAMHNLHIKKLTAIAMIRAGFKESSLLRGTQDGLSTVAAEDTSRTEGNLLIMFNALVLSQNNQGASSPGSRKASLFMAGMGKVMTYGALGLNIKTAAASLGSNFFSATCTGIANWGSEKGLTLPVMNQAYGKLIGADRQKLLALCARHDTLKMDEFDLIHDRLTNGEGIRAGDVISESFIMDRYGDMGVRMWLTAAQMIQDGTWDVYKWDEKTGKLTYDEAAHRKLKGDVYVNAIRDRQIITGELKDGSPMVSAVDDRMRTTLEAWTSDIMGPYKEEVDGIMGSVTALRGIKKFRTHIVGKMNRLTQERHVNDNNGYYEETTGEWVGREEVGMFRSLAALIGGAANLGMSAEAYNQLSEADKFNLKKLATGTAMAVTLMVLASLIFDDDDEKKKGPASLGEYTMHSIIQDLFIFDQLRSGVQTVQNPLIVLDFYDRMGAATMSILSGDVQDGTRIYMRNLGPAKTWNTLSGLYDSAADEQAEDAAYRKANPGQGGLR